MGSLSSPYVYCMNWLTEERGSLEREECSDVVNKFFVSDSLSVAKSDLSLIVHELPCPTSARLSYTG